MNPPSNEAKIEKAIYRIFAKIGIESKMHYLSSEKRVNVVAILNRGKGPIFILDEHLRYII